MTIYTSNLQRLYIAYFDRPADPAGLAFWEGALDNGYLTMATLADNFSASAEFQARQAGLNNSALINRVYVDLFGHDADAGGLLYWTDLLDRGAATPSQVINAIGTEAVGRDVLSMSAKTSFATAFTNYVAATPEGIAAYAGAAANLDAGVRLAEVVDQASLDAQLAQLGKPGQVAHVLAQGGAHPAADAAGADPVVLVGVAEAGHGALHG